MDFPLTRRRFLQATGLSLCASPLLGTSGWAAVLPGLQAPVQPASPLLWGYLAHLGYNMWCDRIVPGSKREYWSATSTLRCETAFWRELMQKAADAGANMIVVDLGEGVRYASHPELGIEGSWSPAMLREALQQIRDLGMEPIPKLNFSTGHDAWLGEYGRQVSTEAYYKVCSDLIAECIELFDQPRFFHLGMDEETAADQKDYGHVVIRQHENWWEDFLKLVGWVEAGGARAWVWSDYEWRHPELFYERMPKSVVQSNWYYNNVFRQDDFGVMAYAELDAAGYDQIPTGSNWSKPDNFELTVPYCTQRIAPERLKGFLQTSWKPTMAETREAHAAALHQLSQARLAYEQAQQGLQD